MTSTELSPQDALSGYLNDHLAGASAGVDLFRRVASTHGDPNTRRVVGQFVAEVVDDRSALLAMMRRLGVRPSQSRVLIGRLGEKLGRLKPNGSIVRRTNLTDLVELEGLILAVRGKLACWHVLRQLAVTDNVLVEAEIVELIKRADSQLDQLEELRRRVAASVLTDA